VVSSVRSDMFFDNAAFDQLRIGLREDEDRDKYPDFSRRLAGLPASRAATTLRPRGAKMAAQQRTVQLKSGLGWAQTRSVRGRLRRGAGSCDATGAGADLVQQDYADLPAGAAIAAAVI